ncbi:hypothetical protein HNY73_007748 [Argiope bruennichi]|uniref:Uncharacterized protein n=1 Tax=Argiope bruennichi TaxID=94029 RepID=A0A8T0FHZ8_ARGBR|nr:hypothetical protein HNY73_007748 [Argiope bruennichi]
MKRLDQLKGEMHSIPACVTPDVCSQKSDPITSVEDEEFTLVHKRKAGRNTPKETHLRPGKKTYLANYDAYYSYRSRSGKILAEARRLVVGQTPKPGLSYSSVLTQKTEIGIQYDLNDINPVKILTPSSNVTNKATSAKASNSPEQPLSRVQQYITVAKGQKNAKGKSRKKSKFPSLQHPPRPPDSSKMEISNEILKLTTSSSDLSDVEMDHSTIISDAGAGSKPGSHQHHKVGGSPSRAGTPLIVAISEREDEEGAMDAQDSGINLITAREQFAQCQRTTNPTHPKRNDSFRLTIKDVIQTAPRRGITRNNQPKDTRLPSQAPGKGPPNR